MNKNTETKGNPHAENMKLYAEDAATHERPWELWETGDEYDEEWHALGAHPCWFKDARYRRKPKTIRIGNIDVPEPMRVMPSSGQHYWTFNNDGESTQYAFCDDEFDHALLNAGMMHSTQEAAKLHWKAIASFTAISN